MNHSFVSVPMFPQTTAKSLNTTGPHRRLLAASFDLIGGSNQLNAVPGPHAPDCPSARGAALKFESARMQLQNHQTSDTGEQVDSECCRLDQSTVPICTLK